jgi:uncharacterized membrane protein
MSDPMHPQAPYQPPPYHPAASHPGLSDSAAGGLAYVTIIPAIIFLIVDPYSRNPFVRFHAWQCIFLSIAGFIAWAAVVVIGFIPFIRVIDLVLSPLVGLGFFVIWLIALVNAFSGKMFKLPVLGDLAEKQANSQGFHQG